MNYYSYAFHIICMRFWAAQFRGENRAAERFVGIYGTHSLENWLHLLQKYQIYENTNATHCTLYIVLIPLYEVSLEDSENHEIICKARQPSIYLRYFTSLHKTFPCYYVFSFLTYGYPNVANITSTISWYITLTDALEDIGKVKSELEVTGKPTTDCSSNFDTPANSVTYHT